MNNSYNYLFKNVGLLTISQFGTKFLSFFLTPLYTYILTTAEYGVFDIYNTTVALLMPILSVNICDGVLRFGLDKNINPEDVFLIGAKYTTISIISFFIFILINDALELFPILTEHSGLLLGMFAATSINLLLGNYARSLEKIKTVAVSSIVNSIFVFGLNILFLVFFKWGIVGYFLAFILGPFSSIIYSLFVLRPHLTIKQCKNKKLNKEMIMYSSAMLLTALGWWVNNASDRYIVVGFCGVAANGIYSVAYKIPSLLKMFQSVFNQAWILSSVKEINSQSREKFFSEIYNYYSSFIIIACSIIIATSQLSAKLLYSLDFYQAWVFVPFLTISVAFDALGGYTEGIFIAEKDTKSIGLSVFIGAFSNIILNIILVLWIGVMGAAISTMVSYGLIWVIRLIWIRKIIYIDAKLTRNIIALFLLLSESCVLLLVSSKVIMYWLLLAHILLIMTLYRKELNKIRIKRY